MKTYRRKAKARFVNSGCWALLVVIVGMAVLTGGRVYGVSWPSVQYVVPEKMVVVGESYSDPNVSYSLYIKDPSGARVDVFSGTWGQGYSERYTLPDPQVGDYQFWKHLLRKDGTTGAILSDEEGQIGSYSYAGGIDGIIDEAVTITGDVSQFASEAGIGVVVTRPGVLTLSNMIFPEVPSAPCKFYVVVYPYSDGGGTIKVENCKNMWLFLNDGADEASISNSTFRFFHINGGKKITIDRSTFDYEGAGDELGIEQNYISGPDLVVSNSAFGSACMFDLSDAFQIDGNDFYGGVTFGGNLSIFTGIGAGSITGNTFCAGDISFNALGVSTHGQILFRDNSFYGGTAAFKGNININDNYWGGDKGPKNLAVRETPDWLNRYGASITHDSFNAQMTFNGSGKVKSTALTPKRAAPSIWVEGLRLGQNALTSDGSLIRKGRSIIVCYDIRTNEPSLDLSNVTFTLNVTGHPASGTAVKYSVRPASTGVKSARRDYWGWWDNHRRTLNFQLEASDYTHISCDLSCDMSSLSQFVNPPAATTINSVSFNQREYFAKPLRIGVIRVKIPWLANARITQMDSMANRLRSDIPALWPLTEKEVEVYDLGTYDFDGGILFGLGVTSFFNFELTNNIANSLVAYMNEYNNSITSSKLDAIVGVVPNGMLPSAAGASLVLRRSAALLDSAHPEAAIHELGHGLISLWIGSEEYDQTTGDRDGYRFVNEKGAFMRNTVAYNPSSMASNGIRGGGAVIFPQDEYLADNPYFDFMGCANPFWILPQSLTKVYSELGSLLGLSSTSPMSASSLLASDPTALGAGALQPKTLAMATQELVTPSRILFSGMLQWNATSLTYALIPETFRARCVNISESNVIAPSGSARAYLLATTTDGAVWSGQSLALYWNDTNQGDFIPWAQTLDYSSSIPFGTYEIFDRYRSFDKTYHARSGLTNSLSATLIPGTDGEPDFVRLHWTASGVVTDTSGSILPLSQTLHYSVDSGATWKLLAIPHAGNELDVSPNMVMTGMPLMFRLLTSDGFTMISSTASSAALTPAQSQRGVVISDPLATANGPEGTLWMLSANVSGSAAQVEWASDLDGDLGEGEHLENVVLSNGTHVLTCAATYADGTASANVSVVVGVPPDLCLRAGDLSFSPGGVDPTTGITGWQSSGTNNLTMNVHNTGTAGYWKLRIYITPPGGAETLLAEEAVFLGVFQGHALSASYAPDVRGVFSIRAEALPDTSTESIPTDAPPTTDADLSNNTITIITGNESPIPQPLWVEAAAGTSTSFILSGADPNGDALDFNVTTQPSHGILSGVSPNLIYTPASGYQGTDKLSFTVSDGLATSASGDVIFYIGNYSPPSPGEVPCLQIPAEITFAHNSSVQMSIASYPRATSVDAINLPPGIFVSADGASLIGSATQLGDYNATLTASNEYGSGPSASVVIHVVGGFKGWIATYSQLSAVDQEALADPDHDGVPNLIEYAMGANPLLSENGQQTRFSFYDAGYQALPRYWVRIHMPWSKAAANDLTWWGEYSRDMITWTKIPANAMWSGVSGYDLDNEKYSDNRYLNTIGARIPQWGGPVFMRFRFSQK